jgi:Holliday junction DNA helicase RuvA
MIGKLRGNIEQINDDRCILDVNGVGYLVFISQKTAQFFRQNQTNLGISLVIETIVKEDAIELYGFVHEIEKIWFLELMKVQGVGAKMAQKILSALTIEELAKALTVGDIKSFNNISGIGPKMASRLTTELKESAKKLGINVSLDFNENLNNQNFSSNQIISDAVSALENLGYKKHDCLKIINYVFAQDEKITLENLITQSLRELSKKSKN